MAKKPQTAQDYAELHADQLVDLINSVVPVDSEEKPTVCSTGKGLISYYPEKADQFGNRYAYMELEIKDWPLPWQVRIPNNCLRDFLTEIRSQFEPHLDNLTMKGEHRTLVSAPYIGWVNEEKDIKEFPVVKDVPKISSNMDGYAAVFIAYANEFIKRIKKHKTNEFITIQSKNNFYVGKNINHNSKPLKIGWYNSKPRLPGGAFKTSYLLSLIKGLEPVAAEERSLSYKKLRIGLEDRGMLIEFDSRLPNYRAKYHLASNYGGLK